VFIPLYVGFFLALSFALNNSAPLRVLAILAGLVDVWENTRILGVLSEPPRTEPRRVGQLKWFLYFATVSVTGCLLLKGVERPHALGSAALGSVLIASGFNGAVAALLASRTGIAASAKLSFSGLAGAALWPLVIRA
jgi:hypothetical protein